MVAIDGRHEDDAALRIHLVGLLLHRLHLLVAHVPVLGHCHVLSRCLKLLLRLIGLSWLFYYCATALLLWFEIGIILGELCLVLLLLFGLLRVSLDHFELAATGFRACRRLLIRIDLSEQGLVMRPRK